VPQRSRTWLYAPYVLVVALALAWAGFWLFAKGRVAAGIDAWVAKESAAGRDWACARRALSGFPFRIEVKCDSVTLTRRTDPSAPVLSLGPLHTVTQIYSPRHIIIESPGPLTASWADGRKATLAWQLGQMSLRASKENFERASLVLTQPAFSSEGLDAEATRAGRMEAHLRPAPARESEQAFDLSLMIDGLVSPGLDQLAGNAQPAELRLSATATRAGAFAGGLTPVSVEAWRGLGGVLELPRFGLKKGQVVLEGNGWLALDDLRRVRGRVEASQSGIDQIGGMKLGGLLDAGALLAGRPAVTTEGGRSLKPLPPIEARDGRIYLGPLRLPGPPLRPVF
jgi:hypothetical protein